MHKLNASLFLSLMLLPLIGLADGISSLTKFYQDTQAMQADFYQVVTDKKGNKIQEVYGHMQLQRPNKFRWDYDRPFEQQIISDGKQVWLYDTELAQVTVRALSNALGTSPAALLAGERGIESSFKLVNAYRKDKLDWVSSQPKDGEAGFSKISLGFKDDSLQAMDLLDSFGHQTRIVFSQVKVNPKMDPRAFVFKVPKGIDVVGDK